MASRRHLKKRARARAARTGCSYGAANWLEKKAAAERLTDYAKEQCNLGAARAAAERVEASADSAVAPPRARLRVHLQMAGGQHHDADRPKETSEEHTERLRERLKKQMRLEFEGKGSMYRLWFQELDRQLDAAARCGALAVQPDIWAGVAEAAAAITRVHGIQRWEVTVAATADRVLEDVDLIRSASAEAANWWARSMDESRIENLADQLGGATETAAQLVSELAAAQSGLGFRDLARQQQQLLDVGDDAAMLAREIGVAHALEEQQRREELLQASRMVVEYSSTALAAGLKFATDSTQLHEELANLEQVVRDERQVLAHAVARWREFLPE